jgi:hypothetical protein
MLSGKSNVAISIAASSRVLVGGGALEHEAATRSKVNKPTIRMVFVGFAWFTTCGLICRWFRSKVLLLDSIR